MFIELIFFSKSLLEDLNILYVNELIVKADNCISCLITFSNVYKFVYFIN